MGASRSLTRKINDASLTLARGNAAKPERMVKYMHVGERLRHLAQMRGPGKLVTPNRVS